MARKRVTQVVKSVVLDASFTADPIPEREVVAARAGRVERRRKHEGAPAPRLPFDNAPGLRVEGNFSRSRLAVGQHQHFAIDLGPAQPHDLAPAAAGLSDMQTGRLLIRAGRLEHARAFLLKAKPTGEEERIERLFLLGRIEMRLGMPKEAAGRFEDILEIRPSLTRVRLELARAYYLIGQHDKARRQFSALLGDKLPSSVEAVVENFLKRIDARKRWSVSISGAIMPESNPAKRTNREEVRIGGVPFRLNEDARASSGVGGLIAAGVSFSPDIGTGLRGVMGASGAAKLYRRSDWNDITVNGDTGLTRLFDHGSVSAGLRLGQRWLGGDPHHRSLGPWFRARLRISDGARLDLSASAGWREHDELSGRNGWRIVVSPGLRYALDDRTLIEAEPVFEVVRAEVERHGYKVVGLGATISRAFESGLAVSASAATEIRRHGARDPLFGKRRKDGKLRLAARFRHRALRYRGIVPYIGYSFERNRSNIPIYAYTNHGAVVGVSRRF